MRMLCPSGLRIGLSNKSFETALLKIVETLDMSREEKERVLGEFEEEVFGYRIRGEVTSLSACVPLKPMVGRAAKSAEDVVEKLLKLDTNKDTLDIFAEIKYDGERTQIHYENGVVSLFSRNFESQNHKFSLLKQRLELYFNKCSSFDFEVFKWHGVSSFVLDGEIVYVDKEGNFLQFQDMERKVKSGTSSTEKFPQVQVFDILQLNGQSLCDFPLKYRKKVIQLKLNIAFEDHKPADEQAIVHCIRGSFYKRLKHTDAQTTATELKALQKRAEEIGCEGLVIKTSSSGYDTSGKRSAQWLKLKNMGLAGEGLQDTLDLVPIGAYHGKGNRRGQFGAYLMASYNSKTGLFESACKVGTGFSKDSLHEFNQLFQSQVLEFKPQSYLTHHTQRLQPDVWLLPNHVWEIGADSITKSPSYMLAGGLSLRFPRFIRTRPDKSLLSPLERDHLFSCETLLNHIGSNEYGSDSNEIRLMYEQNAAKNKK